MKIPPVFFSYTQQSRTMRLIINAALMLVTLMGSEASFLRNKSSTSGLESEFNSKELVSWYDKNVAEFGEIDIHTYSVLGKKGKSKQRPTIPVQVKRTKRKSDEDVKQWLVKQASANLPFSPAYERESKTGQLHEADHKSLSGQEAENYFFDALNEVYAKRKETIRAKAAAVDFMLVVARLIGVGASDTAAPESVKFFKALLSTKEDSFKRLGEHLKGNLELSRILESLEEMMSR